MAPDKRKLRKRARHSRTVAVNRFAWLDRRAIHPHRLDAGKPVVLRVVEHPVRRKAVAVALEGKVSTRHADTRRRLDIIYGHPGGMAVLRGRQDPG